MEYKRFWQGSKRQFAMNFYFYGLQLLWTSIAMDFDYPDRKASVVVDRLRWKNGLG